jgi:hypothetical protein
MLEFGVRTVGQFIEVPRDSEVVPGAIYEIHVDGSGIVGREEDVARLLYESLPVKFPVKINWINISGNSLQFQVNALPEAAGPLLQGIFLFLPEVLGIIGIIITAIGIFLVVAYSPTWTVLMMIGGVILIVLGSVLGQARWKELAGKVRAGG